MRVLWVSNASFCPTGYGVATRTITRFMKRDGIDVDVLAYWGVQGGAVEIEGIRHLPSRRGDDWGNETIPLMVELCRSDLVLTHRDLWVNNPENAKAMPTAAWTPLDHAPPNPDYINNLDTTSWVATMSKWAVEVFRNEGYIVDYVPHSIDPYVFKPGDRLAARKRWWPDMPENAKLVIMVGANKGFPSRKGFVEGFQVMAKLMAEDPNVWLYVHTNVLPTDMGLDIPRAMKLFGVPVDSKRVQMLIPHLALVGIADEDMASLYQAADVLLYPSWGEGFGIPLIEAQACGIPVVSNGFSSMEELTHFGIAVPPESLDFTAHYGFWGRPSVPGLYSALREVLTETDCDSADAVAEAIHSQYSDEVVWGRYFEPWLEKIEAELPLYKRG